MAVEPDGAKLISCCRVNDAEPTAPITDVETVSGRVVSNVVGVIGKFDALDRLERRAVKHITGATFRIDLSLCAATVFDRSFRQGKLGKTAGFLSNLAIFSGARRLEETST